MTSLIAGQVTSMTMKHHLPPAPEPTPGRKDVNLSSGSYTYSDEESEGQRKTVLKAATDKSGVKGESPATLTRAKATSPTKSPERSPELSRPVPKPAPGTPVRLKEKSRSSASVKHGAAAASQRSHRRGDDRVRSRSRSRHSRDRHRHRGTSRRRMRRNKPHSEKRGRRHDRESTRRRGRSPTREPIQRKHAGQVSSNAKHPKEKKYPDGVVCEYCGKELQNSKALWQHQESSNLCREYQGKGDARKPCASCQKRVTNQEWSWEQHYLASPSCRPKQIQNAQPSESDGIGKKGDRQETPPLAPPISELAASSSSLSGADMSHLANFFISLGHMVRK